MSLLTNAPLWLLGMLVLAGLGSLVTGVQRDQKKLRTLGFILVIAALLLGILRWTVPTAEKKVDRQTRELVAAVSDGNWDLVHQLVKHTHMMNWEGDDLANHAQTLAEQYHLKSIGVTSVEVVPQSPLMVATLHVISHHTNEMYESVPSTWHLEFQKSADQWVLTNITPIKIGQGDVADAEQLLR